MATFFLIIAALAVIHFIYEGILAPSIRMHLRFRLFALRDEVRALKCEQSNPLPDDIFLLLQSGINNAIVLLHKINIYVTNQAQQVIENDKELARTIESRIALIENCKSQEAKNIHREACKTIEIALIVNNGGLWLYIIPVFLAYRTIASVATMAKEVIVLREPEFQRIVPSDDPRFAFNGV